jgi:Ser/Thr protein kinase RdoA (MazF antagonist)
MHPPPLRLPVPAVCEAFALGSPRRRPVLARGGHLHRVWRLDTDSGSFAVKRLVAEAERLPGWEWDYASSFELERAALEAGLPMPEPVPARDGDWLAELEDDGGRRARYRVHNWLEGRTVPDQQGSPAQAAEAGELLARIHGLGLSRRADPEQVLPTAPAGDWRQRELEVPELAGMASLMEEVNRAVADTRPLVQEPRLGHGDFNPNNVLRTPAGPALIDWEWSRPLEARLELAAAAIDWAGAFWWEPRADLAAAVLHGYRGAGGRFPAPEDVRIFGGWLLSLTGWVWRAYRRALSGRTESERRQGRWSSTFAVHQLRRCLGARPRWLELLRQ